MMDYQREILCETMEADMGSSFDRIVNQSYRNLTDIDIQVLQKISDEMELVPQMSIGELAERCNVSTATIVRMTRHLGFEGYSDFKYYLRHESKLGRGKRRAASSATAASATVAEDITQTIRLFDRTNQLDELYARMAGARKVYAFGTGYGQRLMLEDFCRCMQMIGRDVVMIPATGELRLVKQYLGKDDLLIIASLSGCVDRYRDVFQTISVCGTPIVSITNLGNNELASYTAYNLYFQNGNIFDDINMSSSSFVTMHLVLHLLFEGFKEWLELND